MFVKKDDYITQNIQIAKFQASNVDLINVYRSSQGNSMELLQKVIGMVAPGRSTLLTGDFNICYSRNPNNRMSKGFKTEGFNQLINEPTHILGGHIDHVYWKMINEYWKDPVLERYSPYYSDHDATCITLVKQVFC